jgi:carbon monoxide dehydrogenase subunit G
MASIYREATITAPIEKVWAAIADVQGINRLITFLGKVTVDGDHRSCQLGEQGKLEELIVTVDDANKRFAYSVQESPFNLTHHSASMQLRANGEGTELMWVTDLKPDDAAPAVEEALDAAVASIKEVLG